MLARDRELLARIARVNGAMGPVVVELLHRQDGGGLPADGVRELGCSLAALGGELLDRADELDRCVIDTASGEQ